MPQALITSLSHISRELAAYADAIPAQKADAASDFLGGVARALEPGRVAVAWTGGKDSTLALFLWRQAVAAAHGEEARVRAVSLDTGMKFPEIVTFRDTLAEAWNLDLEVVRPKCPEGLVPARDKVACCRALKIDPLRAWLAASDARLLLTGIRRDEHPSRASLPVLERQDDPPHLRIHPLLFMSELDVWTLTLQEGLSYCRLYDQGYRSLGCRPCTAAPGAEAGEGERGGRAPDKEASMELLRSLGYF